MPLNEKRLFFTVPGEVKGQGRPRATVRGGHAAVYERAEDRSYKGLIQFHAMKAIEEQGYGIANPDDTGIFVDIVIYIAIPKSMSMKRRAMAIKGTLCPQRKPDLDNVMKAVLDAMNGVVYRDDAQVTEAHVSRWYSENPRLEVRLHWREEAED